MQNETLQHTTQDLTKQGLTEHKIRKRVFTMPLFCEVLFFVRLDPAPEQCSVSWRAPLPDRGGAVLCSECGAAPPPAGELTQAEAAPGLEGAASAVPPSGQRKSRSPRLEACADAEGVPGGSAEAPLGGGTADPRPAGPCASGRATFTCSQLGHTVGAKAARGPTGLAASSASGVLEVTTSANVEETLARGHRC